MQCVRLLGRITNISVLRKEAVLRRKLFTMEGSGKGNIVPCSTARDVEQDKKILQPLTYMLQSPGKDVRRKLVHAFNYWLKVPAHKVNEAHDIVKDLHHSSLLIDDIQDNSVLRRGAPVAHKVYGLPSTINAAIYLLLTGLEKSLSFNHPEAVTLCTEQLLELYHGQGMELYWRDNCTCPSVKEYEEISKRKTGALFTLAIQLMQLFSENKADFTKLTGILGLYYQIWNDYRNLCLQEYAEDKGSCEDLTEGQFTFPLIHAIKSHPDDNQVLHILRQRTRDVALKEYCVTLLEKFGSFSYTKHTLEELDAEARAEAAKLGGNPLLEAFLDELLKWKSWRSEKKPEQ